jgi:hypothetical protein
MAVPTNPGVGAAVDLSDYGYNKTFIATGDPGLDAMIECSNDDVTYVPVARLIGEVAAVLPMWGKMFRVRRIDGRQVPASASVKAASSLGTLRVSLTSMLIADAPFVVAVDHLNEPMSILCWADPGNPSANGSVAVSGINGAESVRIGTLSPGQQLNIDNGADFDSLSFDITDINDVNAVLTVSVTGKTPDASLPEGIMPYFSMLKVVSDGAGGLSIAGEAVRTMARVTGVVTVAPGQYEIAFNRPLPLSTGAMEFVSIMTNDNIFGLSGSMSDPQTFTLYCRNAAGVLTAPGGLFQGNIGVLLY